MMDGEGPKGLNDLRDEAYSIALAHGFKDASIGEDVALMHSELSELLEAHRDGEPPTKVWYEEEVHGSWRGEPIVHVVRHDTRTTVRRKPCGIPSELADVIIRALHFAGKHGIDIEQVVEEKMRFNATRPFKHGGKKL